MDHHEAIAASIREIREAIGLSQREAADRIGCTNVHLCELESGRQNFTFAMLDEISSAYKEDVVIYAVIFHLDLGYFPPVARPAIKAARTLGPKIKKEKPCKQ